MTSPSSEPPQVVAHADPSEHFDYVSVGINDRSPSEYLADDSTEGCDTPNYSDFTPTRRVQSRPQVTVNVYNTRSSGSGTGGAATIHDECSTAKDEVIADLTSQLATLSRRVDELSLKQASSPLVIDSGTWSTLKVRSWEHPQVHTAGRVSFSKKFKTAPNVRVSMSAADVSRNANFRVKVYATDIDTTGFTANANTWADTKMHSCEISWLAIGS